MNTYILRELIFISLLAALVSCGPAEQGGEEAAVSMPEIVPLEGSNWQLLQLTVPGGFIFTPDDPGKYVLNFRSENRLTGTSDCNQLTGSWRQEGTALFFEPFSSTRSLCPPGSLHNNLVLHLRNVTTQNFSDGHMYLTTNTEGVELEFEVRD